MANLPDKLINEILLWLPVKSLLRFRCVCKAFCANIESQSFINSHFKRSSENNIRRKLIDLGIHKTANYGLQIQALAFDDDLKREVVLEKSYPAKYPIFFSYCNGLVLLAIDELAIWNRSTRQYRMLLAMPVKYFKCIRKFTFGLGYDSTTDEYKVVVFFRKKDWRTSQVWILGLRSCCRRQLEDLPCVWSDIEGIGNGGGNGDCFVDGAVHFTCRFWGDFDKHVVLAFDVAKETFSVADVSVTRAFPTRLQVFRGCLCYGHFGLRLEPGITMRVRKKDGDAYTWTGLYYIADDQLSMEEQNRFEDGNVAYSKEGDKVFLSLHGRLLSYDLKDKSIQQIASTNINNLDIFSCIETLASVGIARNESAGGKKRKRVLKK